MADEIADIYRVESLEKYDLRDRVMIRLTDLVFFCAISLIGKTIRWEVQGIEHLDAVTAAGKQPIYCLWHDRIFAGTYFLRDRGIVVLTSQSKDGEYIARFLRRFGFGAIRGSSSRGGVKALVGMIRSMRRGSPMAFTVDGPRGPRYEAKAGPVLLAQKTGNPMLPFSVECKSFRTVKSWDRLQIPIPFTRALFNYSAPIYVPPDKTGVDEKLAELQASLDGLVKLGQEWH